MGARGDAICAHLCSFASAADGAWEEEEAGHKATRRLLIISRAFLWPATVGGAQYVDTITFRQTDRQRSGPISVVSNSTHSQLERPINSLTGATLVRHFTGRGGMEPNCALCCGGSALPLALPRPCGLYRTLN